MSERPDIGKMIDEELAKGGAPEDEGAKPLEVRGNELVRGQSPDQARPMTAEAKGDAAGKKDLWEKERQAHAEAFEKLRAERAARPKEGKDALTDAELDELRAVIAQAAKENDKISTAVLKEGIAVADETTLHPYDKGLESISDKLLSPDADFYKQALMLLNNQPDGKVAMQALGKKMQERVESLAKRTEQLKRNASPRIEAKPAAEIAAPKESPVEAKKKAAREAMQPFYDDVSKMLKGDRLRKEREEAEKRSKDDDKKPPSFWDKLFGKKAA